MAMTVWQRANRRCDPIGFQDWRSWPYLMLISLHIKFTYCETSEEAMPQSVVQHFHSSRS